MGVTALTTGIGMDKGNLNGDSSGSMTKTRTTSASWDNEWNRHSGDDWRRRWCRGRRRRRGYGWESNWYWRKCRPWDGPWMNQYHLKQMEEIRVNPEIQRLHVFTNSYYTYRSPHTGTWRIRIERNYEKPGIAFYEDIPEEFGFMISTIQKINEIMAHSTTIQDYMMNMSCLLCWIPWHLSKSSQQKAFKEADAFLKNVNLKMEKCRWTMLTKNVGLFLEYEYLE